MPAAKFCSVCGERLKTKRPPVLPFRSFCARCSPRFRTARLVFAVTSICAAIIFVAIRFSARPEPFQFIGSPVDSNAAGITSALNDRASNASQSVEPSRSSEGERLTIAVVGICGAPTKSGKPCQRKVKGGGYCWQHRDKYSQSNMAPAANR
jgi:hypothetical protein